ncbi:MAG: 4Fe-4S dicluster domain-containing protein, partial [Bacillota bacterium]|nr:4Fe-4S dicluster domain-containing protein [Bacillota bacterium]
FSIVGTAATASILGAMVPGELNANTSTVILQGAKGVVMADPTRCTGCKRCEIACTNIQDGKTHPYVSRIKVSRNYNFGPQGAYMGMWRTEGQYGNFRIIPETCKQCKHPVPCAIACPQKAISADSQTGARVVDEAKCVGCGMCASTCPWYMITVDPDKRKASKCNLCSGDPACVNACPTRALVLIPWKDFRRDTPIRNYNSSLPTGAAFDESCGSCHGK